MNHLLRALMRGKSSSPVAPPGEFAMVAGGVNIGDYGGVSQYNALPLFANMIRNSRTLNDANDPNNGNFPFVSTVDGWPVSDFALMYQIPLASEYNQTFYCRFNGQATVSAGGVFQMVDAPAYDVGTNITRFSFKQTGPASSVDDISPHIKFTNTKRTSASPANSGITDLRIARPGHDVDNLPKFSNNIAALFAPFSGPFRWMDAANVNNCTLVVKPEDLPRDTFMRFGQYYDPTTGQPINWNNYGHAPDWPTAGPQCTIDDVIDFGNFTQKGQWMCIWAGANDDAIRAFAEFYRDNATGDWPLYLEYINEFFSRFSSSWVVLAEAMVACDGFAGQDVAGYRKIVSASRTSNVLTLVLPAPHGKTGTVEVGVCNIDGVPNGRQVATVVDATTVTLASTGADSTNTAGFFNFDSTIIFNPDGYLTRTKFTDNGSPFSADEFSNYALANRYIMARICQISEIFRSVLGDAAMSARRVRCIYADQISYNGGNSYTLERELMWGNYYCQTYLGRPLGEVLYGTSGAPYFPPVGAQGQMDGKATTDDRVPVLIDWVDQNIAWHSLEARHLAGMRYGLRSTSYEGGSHWDSADKTQLVAQHDMRTKDSVVKYLDDWTARSHGGEFCWYASAWASSNSVMSGWPWTLVLDDPETSAHYVALRETAQKSLPAMFGRGQLVPGSFDARLRIDKQVAQGAYPTLNQYGGNWRVGMNRIQYAIRVTVDGDYTLSLDYRANGGSNHSSGSLGANAFIDGSSTSIGLLKTPWVSADFVGTSATLPIGHLTVGPHYIEFEVSGGSLDDIELTAINVQLA